ncbi:hypothetical protein NDA01_26780 [Trichocoleus desertorum AS-A10]|uniref:hypothetical protein n=1 Tax=Trichocoleus desertorum TaxID=1481672 RepID=UPI0032995E98
MHNLTLPSDWSLPKFSFNQAVRLKRNDEIGVIVGLQYERSGPAAGWHYELEFQPDSQTWEPDSIECAHESDLETLETASCACEFVPAALPLSRDARIQAVLSGICHTLHQPLEPVEYCQRWVFHPLHLQNYKQACDQALAQACGLLSADVQLWGKEWRKRPGYVPYLLRLADTVKRSQTLGVCAAKVRSQTPELSLPIPKGIPCPRFHFWQQVRINDEWNEHGTVVGMEYQNGWWYAIELDPDTPHKFIEPVRHSFETEVQPR